MFDFPRFVHNHPRLFHLSSGNSWQHISTHGLLCTTDILGRCSQSSDQQRLSVYEARRQGDLPLDVPGIGTIVVRDQKPLCLAGLQRALEGHMLPLDWVDLLNDRVFFWIRSKDAHNLVNAKSYRETDRTLLEFDTASIIDAYRDRIAFTDFNVGYTRRKPKRRGAESFVRMDNFLGKWHEIRELTIRGSLADALKHIQRVTLLKATGQNIDLPI